MAAASASTISTLYGFSTMSFLVAVMPAPSLSLMMPASWSRSSARASLVVSLGTAILMTLSEALSPPLLEPEHAARLNASTTASASAIILVNFFIFVFSLKVLKFNGPCRLSVINILCVPGTHSHDLPFHTAHLLSNRNRRINKKQREVIDLPLFAIQRGSALSR